MNKNPQVENQEERITQPFIMLPELILEMLDDETKESLEKHYDVMVTSNEELSYIGCIDRE